MKPVLALTMGDPAGIGPEIVVATLKDPSLRRVCAPLVVGAREVLWRYGWRPELAPLLDPGASCSVKPGHPTAEGGRASFEAVRLGASLARRGLIHGIVTAPISKEAWKWAGVPYADHTGYLKDLTGASDAAMMLVCGDCRAVLATRHMPLLEAARTLSSPDVVKAAKAATRALRKDMRIPSPSLGLCALNPHAGENGLLGHEERRVLAPAVRSLRRAGLKISDPLPADSAWALHRGGRFDALVALYHDQALIPLKVINPYGIVNWTLGLPFVRTSPGHGTAFDIAGRRRARPDAMIQAALLAARL